MKALQSAHSVSGIFNMSEEDNLAVLNQNLDKLNLNHLETQLIRPRAQRGHTTVGVYNNPEPSHSNTQPRSFDRYHTISHQTLNSENSHTQSSNEVEYYDNATQQSADLENKKVKITQKHKRGRRGGKKLKKRLERLKKSQKKKFNKVVETIIYQNIIQQKRLANKKQRSAQPARGDCKCMII